MYSRYPERPIRVPEHYSGCAFPGGSGGTGESRRTPTEPKREPVTGTPRPGPTTYPHPTILPQSGAAPAGSAQVGSAQAGSAQVGSAQSRIRQSGDRTGILSGAPEGTTGKGAPSQPPAPEPSAPPRTAGDEPSSPALLLPAPGRADGKRETPGKGLQGLLHGTSFPFSEGMEFDELLILGIMLLLSRNDGDPDLLPLLALLLFCG